MGTDLVAQREDNRYRHVLLGVLMLLAALVVGAVGLVLIEGFSFLDGLYMALITVSTVGFGEVAPLSPPGRVLIMFLIVTGLGLATYTVGAIGTLLLEGQLRRIVGRRIMRRELESLRDHHIVCGYGRMGRIICDELDEEKRSYVVLTLDEEVAEELRERGKLALAGDATEDDMLMLAGIERAKTLVAVTSTDVDNLYITLTARELSRRANPGLYILSRGVEEKACRKIRRAGADRVISPYQIGGLRMVQALLRPKVYDYMEVVASRSGDQLLVEEFTLREGDYLVGRAIRDTDIRAEYDLIIIGVNAADGRMTFNPKPDHELAAADTLILLGATEQLRRLEKALGR